jgi:hypothetical protein
VTYIRSRPPAVPAPTQAADILCFDRGREASWTDFCFRPQDGPLYVDGSSLHGREPAVTIAAAAVVQGSPLTGFKHCSVLVPTAFPPGAPTAEHLGLNLAVRAFFALPPGSRPVARPVLPSADGSDCVSVVQYAAKNRTARLRSPMAGFWLDRVDANARLCVFHVRSHRAEPPATTAAWLRWAGSRKADEVARDRASSARDPNVVQAPLLWNAKFTAYVKTACAPAEEHLPSAHRALPAKAVRPRLSKRARNRSSQATSDAWIGPPQGRACSACGLRRRRGGQRTRPTERSGLLRVCQLVHEPHSLQRAQTPTGPLVFCARCGHYAAHRVDRLGLACATVAVAALRRLRRQLDPRDRRPISGVRPILHALVGWAPFQRGELCIRAGEAHLRLGHTQASSVTATASSHGSPAGARRAAS